MRVLDTVALILKKKSSDVWSVPSDATVYSVMQMMADKDVGALLVMENDELVGVVSERDYARKVALLGRSSNSTSVREIMSMPAITIGPECTIDEAMRLMVINRVRYLPVLCNNKILGIVSIGDLVNSITLAQDQRIEHLERYIVGQYPC
jgi:CBS domain-containing protein